MESGGGNNVVVVSGCGGGGSGCGGGWWKGGRGRKGGREKEATRTLCFALNFKKTKRNGEITVPPANFLQKNKTKQRRYALIKERQRGGFEWWRGLLF